jgi:raffinose/stachyose/melibiose transport system permease protein
VAAVQSKHTQIALYTALGLYAVIAFFPIYFALVSSVKESQDIFLNPFGLPDSFEIENFARALSVGNIATAFRNSVILTSATVLLTGIGSAMAGFVLARFDFGLKNVIYIFFIAGLMIPVQSVVIPLSFNFGRLGLYDNMVVMILLFTAFQLPISVFIVTGFLKSIPRELEESAVIDGCHAGQVFRRIILPLSLPGVTTASVFNFLSVWNNLLFPLVFVRKQNLQVIALALQSFFAERVSDYGGVMAAIVISILPPIIAYVVLQEKVEKGMTAGAVKG